MSEEDKHFIKRYEELLDKGYCDCNEMNCIDNNSPRRILNIVKDLQNQLQQKENIINKVREDLDKQITFCTNEANGTTNDKYCRIALNYLKHLKDKIQESKDDESC